MASEKRPNQRWKVILSIVTLVAIVGLLFALRENIIDTFQNLADINAYLLILYLPLQALNYHGYARLYQTLLSIFNEHVPYKKMYRVALEMNFVNNVFPSGGVSGFSYFSIRMRSAGIPTAKATLTQILRFAAVFISFQILLVLGLLLLALDGKANGLMILIAGSIVTALLIGTVLLSYIIGSKQRINTFFGALTRFLNKIIHLFKRDNQEAINIDRAHEIFNEIHANYGLVKQNPVLLRKPLMFALLANLTEIATIYLTYVAFGFWINPGAVIIAYAIANFAGLLSVLPGGIGVYEALTTATLVAAGVPASISLPVTIMYRVLTMLVQLPPGYYFYHKNLRKTESVI